MGLLYLGNQKIAPVFGGDGAVITAMNDTGRDITSGSKVWINETTIVDPTGNQYNNFTKHGSISVNKSFATNFSSSNYLELPNILNIGTQDFEIVIACKETSSSSSYVLAGTANKTIAISPNACYISTGGGTYNVNISNSTSISINTKVWIKITRVGSTFTKYTSLDGVTWTTQGTATNASALNVMRLNIGFYNYESSKSFIGEVYLEDCYIKVGNEFWWQPRSLYTYDNFGIYGAVGVNYGSGEISNFSVSNYISPYNNFTPENNPWEMVFAITLTQSGNYNILNNEITTNFSANAFLYQSGTNLTAYLTSNASSYNIVNGATVISSLALNTKHKIKIEFTGNAYKWYLWESGAWSLKTTITSSIAVLGGLPIFFGTDTHQGQFSFNGYIDLSEAYIKINNDIWWNPKSEKFSPAITLDTITGYAKENIALGASGKVSIAKGE